MRAKLSVWIAVGGVLLVASPLLVAHHSVAAEFDMTKPVTVTGTLTRMDWKNPHCWIYIDVTNTDGTVVAWEWEMGAPNSLIRAGWRKTDLPIGAVITVQGFSAKEGLYIKPTGSTRMVTLPDGKKLFDLGSGPPPTAEK